MDSCPVSEEDMLMALEEEEENGLGAGPGGGAACGDGVSVSSARSAQGFSLPRSSESAASAGPAIDGARELLHRAEEALKEHFGYSQFRPFQKLVIEAILAGRDAFVLQSTGSGKSLVYQIPALVPKADGSRRVVLVVSPLVSLMNDQVQALEADRIRAVSLSDQKRAANWADCLAGNVSLVYITPELLRTPWGAEQVPRLHRQVGIGLVAIDEAHCVSEWGHDFRPEYRQLGELRAALPGIPMVALTATATARVRADIIANLGLRRPVEALGSFDRPNLSYEVHDQRSAAGVLSLFAGGGRGPGCTLIYCQTRRDSEDLGAQLERAGVRTAVYHAGMSEGAREGARRRFMMDEVDAMVATTAFGMGIDKRDIRRVVHFGLCGSLESYYQQTGRAGRDGAPSDCILFYHAGDFVTQNRLKESGGDPGGVASAHLAAMRRFVSTAECRKQVLLEYFEEACAPCLKCDNCRAAAAEQSGHSSSRRSRNLAVPSAILLWAVGICRNRFGMGTYVDFVRGARSKRMTELRLMGHKTHGLGLKLLPRYHERFWKLLGEALSNAGYLGLDPNSKFLIYQLTPKGDGALALALPWLEWAAASAQKMPGADLHVLAASEPDPPQVSDRTAPAYPAPLALVCGEGLLEQIDGALRGRMAADTGASHPKARDSGDVPESWGAQELKLFSELQSLRRVLANEQQVPAYVIMSNAVLKNVVETRPTDTAHLMHVEGIGPVKAEKYGPRVVTLVAQICAEVGLSTNVDRCATGRPAAVRDAGAPGQSSVLSASWDAPKVKLYSELYSFRTQLAREQEVVAGAILSDDQLKSLVDARPVDTEHLLQVLGIDSAAALRCSKPLLSLIAQSCSELGLSVNDALPPAASSGETAPLADESGWGHHHGDSVLSADELRDVDELLPSRASRHTTFKNFLGGKSVAQAAAEAGIKASTASSYVLECFEEMADRSAATALLARVWSRLEVASASHAVVRQVAEAADLVDYWRSGRKGAVKAQLPDTMTWDVLNAILLRLKLAGRPPADDGGGDGGRDLDPVRTPAADAQLLPAKRSHADIAWTPPALPAVLARRPPLVPALSADPHWQGGAFALQLARSLTDRVVPVPVTSSAAVVSSTSSVPVSAASAVQSGAVADGATVGSSPKRARVEPERAQAQQLSADMVLSWITERGFATDAELALQFSGFVGAGKLGDYVNALLSDVLVFRDARQRLVPL